MPSTLRLAIIGLDTSHTIEFTRRLMATDCPADKKVAGAVVTRCLRFATPFQNEDGLGARQKQMEEWGVTVTTSIDEAVADCDALLLEINDPSRHLEYFTICAGLGKPIFLDKPLADTIQNGRAICKLASEKGTRVFSASSLRCSPHLVEACRAVPEPIYVHTYGPLGTAAAGSSIVWYGVHSFEMLERAMGRGAKSVRTVTDDAGATCVVTYPDSRRGVVELNKGSYLYGGTVRAKDKAAPFVVDSSMLYSLQLADMIRFFNGGEPPVAMEDALEVMAMLDAAERSAQSGKPEPVEA